MRTRVLDAKVRVFSLLLIAGLSGACTASSSGDESIAASASALGAEPPRSDSERELYVPEPNPAAIDQIEALRRAHQRDDAALLSAMADTPQSVWLVGGTPESTAEHVQETLKRARVHRRLPVFVAYNIPFRDCSGLSAGGATTGAEYLAWIDAIATALGDTEAMVMLEPDSLGIIPHFTNLGGAAEWCQPADANPATAASDRFAQLGAAIDRLRQQPHVSVYLDGTHSHWLGSGDAAWRLSRAGIARANGFFLNASNFQASERLEKYGTWISSCLAFANNAAEGSWRLGHYDWCASQYYPANVDDFTTWSLSDDWYRNNLGSAVATTRFVIDTGRNGQGPWSPPSDTVGDPQDWCNPPGRGLGYRPALCDTTSGAGTESCARTPLLEANLWLKVPGESDGQCTRWATSGSVDPARGMVVPTAGAWFPEQALELARLANPALSTKH